MPKPVCVKCQRFYRCKKTGICWTEMMPIGGEDAVPGVRHPELWTPYKIWHSDLYRCEGCGHEIIVGHGQLPLAEVYQKEFMELMAESEAYKITINDC